jgi:hypothetical protein
MTKRVRLPPGDIQRVLSTTLSKPSKTDVEEITINGKQYRFVHMARTIYSTPAHRSIRRGALVDRGANGGIAGDDVRGINRTHRQVDVQGIDNHQIVDIPIATVGAVVKTQHGDVIAIMHQYAYTGKGKTIYSSGQLKWFRQDVNDRSMKVKGGPQCIKTVEGYCIPINIILHPHQHQERPPLYLHASLHRRGMGKASLSHSHFTGRMDPLSIGP